MLGTDNKKGARKPLDLKGTMMQEVLTHFSCAYCKSWWTIGDAPDEKRGRHCPSCGMEQEFKNITKQKPKLA